MGNVSGGFKMFEMFADASSSVMRASGWKGKLAAGFTNSHSFAGDKEHALSERRLKLRP
jgi:NAD(P)H dehydrogenase (quinone)